jgi:hypothetical protein
MRAEPFAIQICKRFLVDEFGEQFECLLAFRRQAPSGTRLLQITGFYAAMEEKWTTLRQRM